MSGFGRKAKRMKRADRFFGKNRRAGALGAKAVGLSRRFFRPRFELLEDRRLLSVAGINWDSGFLPASLINHGSVSGELSAIAPENVYSVSLAENQTITAVVDGDTGVQPVVSIANADGAVLATSTAPEADGIAILQTVSVQNAGIYTIAIADFQGAIGQYYVEITVNAAVELEELGMVSNGTRSVAQPIDASLCELSSGAAYRGAVVGGLDSAVSDQDWFSFSLEAGVSATLLAAADPGYLQTNPLADERPLLEIFDSQGARLAVGVDVDISTNDNSTILGQVVDNFTPSSGGTFYACLSGLDAAYSLVLTTDCAFDLGNNTSPDDESAQPPWQGGLYQDITGRDGVLGEIDGSQSGWTFMVYLDADNNLEGAGIEDFLEMASVGSTDEVNIVVQMDRAYGSGTNVSYGNWTTARRGLVAQGDVPDANWGTDIGEVDMGSAETVIDFVQWAVQEYPADKYAIVYWDHGNGIEGVCVDDSSGNTLAIADFTTIISAVPDVDIVGFDACLMAMLEVGYQYRNGADVMVSSEASELLDGWEYQNFLDKLIADPTMDAEALAGHIIDAFQARYDYSGDSTLSSVDLTRIVNPSTGLVAYLNQFAAWMADSATAGDWDAVQAASGQARRWDQPACIDLGDFISRVSQASISTELSAITNSLLTSLDSVVLQNYCGTYASSTGLSIYLPQLSGYISSVYNDSLDFLADTRWDDFVSMFMSTVQVSYTAASVTYGPEQFVAGETVSGFSIIPLSGSLYRRYSKGDDQLAQYDEQDDIVSSEPVMLSQTAASESWGNGDWYCVEMSAGDWMTAWTTTPGDDESDFQNLLDPCLELYGPAGELLTADDNTFYGINALISHSAAVDGRYWIRVKASPDGNGAPGEYYLRVIGSGELASPQIAETDLPDGSRQEEQPSTVAVTFSEQILLTSLDYYDLTIDGVLHSVGCSVIDGNTIRFSLPAGLADGSHELGFAAGSILDIQETPIDETYWTFYIGPAPPRVLQSTIHQGDTLPAGICGCEVVFDQQLDGDAIDASDILLTGTVGQVEITGFNYDEATYTLTVEFPALSAGNYTLILLSGDGQFESITGLDIDGEQGDGTNGLPTGDGNPGGDFSVSFIVNDESQVLGRHIFYNNSAWDGNQAAADAADDEAIAVDKQALLPGETAALENYTSYAGGINGIMIDVGFVPLDVTPGIEDFEFLVGNSDDPSTWAAAPDPIAITIRRGEGVNGSDRITIIWADGAISKQWLQVTAYSARLGMGGDDVFYWGNAVGETGDNPTQALVNATDILAARNNPCGPTPPAAISNPYDFNRDGLVDLADVTIAVNNTTSVFSALRLISPPEIVAETFVSMSFTTAEATEIVPLISVSQLLGTPAEATLPAAAHDAVFSIPPRREPEVYGPVQYPRSIEAAWLFHWAKDDGEKTGCVRDNKISREKTIDALLARGLF